MGNRQTGRTPKYRWITWVAGGYLILMYLSACVIAGILGDRYRQQIPWLAGHFPTVSPSPTPSPQVLVPQAVDPGQVQSDDFSDDSNDWGTIFRGGKVEVIDGKLLLQSNLPGYDAIATERKQPPSLNVQSLYVQADLTTDVDGNGAYGLVFNMDEEQADYYVFEISRDLGLFSLLKNSLGKWDTLSPAGHYNFRAFPQENTLSVHSDPGRIDLYINGDLVSSYVDPHPYHSGGYGFFVGDAGFRLIADNLFTYTSR